MDSCSFATDVLRWYDTAARDLPWRRADTTPWGVLVSEVMLQQTPVARVLPVWTDWLARWPAPNDLAAATAGDAVRAWGRLGYPRRALRLHASATTIVADHGGEVPCSVEVLRTLPGIGDYTAAAVVAFAYGARAAVLDTNVRRVYARAVAGVAAATGAPTVGEREAALARVPAERPGAYSVAMMELGALLCTARSPQCAACPLSVRCEWLRAGRPESALSRRVQTYEGTDRQARGRLLAVLRDAPGPVDPAALEVVWTDATQRTRALDGLVADGLVEPVGDGRFRLPA